MKLSEMMDNDLFRYGGHLCRFVICAMSAYIERLSDGSTFPPCVCVEAEPIPLTKEILKANGFSGSKIDKQYVLYDETDCPLFSIVIRKKNNMRYGFWIPVSWYGKGCYLDYIHELQHALRLCSLNELADNFKIL